MKTLKLETFPGNNFTDVSKGAKDLSKIDNQIVEFNFNGIKCLVNKKTNLNYLYRDYNNSFLMDWKKIGPNCTKYTKEIEEEIKKREKIQEEKRNQEQQKQDAEDKIEKETFENKSKGVKIELSDSIGWNKEKEINISDAYGLAIFEYAEYWAKLMQVEISNGKQLKDIAEKTSFELNFLGITGFMYGAAVQILSDYWKYGEELRKWHNKEYNYDGDGVVNPAIININI